MGKFKYLIHVTYLNGTEEYFYTNQKTESHDTRPWISVNGSKLIATSFIKQLRIEEFNEPQEPWDDNEDEI